MEEVLARRNKLQEKRNPVVAPAATNKKSKANDDEQPLSLSAIATMGASNRPKTSNGIEKGFDKLTVNDLRSQLSSQQAPSQGVVPAAKRGRPTKAASATHAVAEVPAALPAKVIEQHYSDEDEEEEDNDVSDVSESSEEEQADHHHQEEANRLSEEEEEIQEVPRETKPARVKPASHKTVAAAAAANNEPAGSIPKALLVRLIKSSGVQGICSDVIDTSKEIIENIIQDTIKNAGITGVFKSSHVNEMIEKNFKEGDAALPEDITISPQIFDAFIRPHFVKANISYKRDASYIFQLYCEAYLIKMLRAADMVAGSAKRSRIQGSDLTVAYYIFNS